MAVSLPIISQLKVQCCPLPTSIFSNHTGFPSFFFEDFTSKMESYIAEWKKLDLHFAGINTGFLGSADQIRIVSDFLRDFKTEETIVIIDPVMGDYGNPYPTYTMDMCQRMKELIHYADILTPNLTEACILSDTPYRKNWKVAEVTALAEKLSEQGPEKVVITGIPQKSYVCNLCYEKGQDPSIIKTQKVGTERSGTGDIFSAIISADAVNLVPFQESVKKASHFIKRCILKSIELDIPLTDGVCFEEVLHTLH
jgi:pyridoxine kinase